jgi:hypothetical protein
MQFVWFHVPGPDDSGELRYSIRSVTTNCAECHRVTVIGDKPKWYTGHHIPHKRITRPKRVSQPMMKYEDTNEKMILAASHPEIDREFCWMMDDQYFLQSVSVEELKTPRFDPHYRVKSGRSWHQMIRKTFAALTKRGYGTLQYGTHLPHVFEQEKLREMFVEFEYSANVLLSEIVYGNRYRVDAIPYTSDNFLKRLQAPHPVRSLDKIATENKVLNHLGRIWQSSIRKWIPTRFPDPSPYEAS